jgi:predicted porin
MQSKKILTALGLAVLSVPVWAQQNAQVYGIADVGVEFLNHVPVPGGGSKNLVGVQSGNIQTSRLGFRGTEDLGGGLKANFGLESGFSMDTGTLNNGGRLFGRNAWVGLSGAYGQIQLGRQVNTVYDFGVAFDPYSGMRYSGTTYDAAYAGRADNAIKYLGQFGGLDVRAQYSMGYDGARGIGEVPGAFKVGKEMGAFATYDFANVRIGATYDRQNGATVATQNDKDVRMGVGLTAIFKPMKLYAAYERRSQDVGVRSTDTDLYWIGAGFPVTPALTVTANAYVLDPQGPGNRSSMLVVYGSYGLSKRTSLYTMLALAKNQALARISPGGTVNPGDGQTGLVVGIRHLF